MRVEDIQIRSALTYTSGTADRNGTAIDTAGYEWAVFVVTFATIASSATTSVKVQQDTASAMSGAADLEGTSISVADDDDDQVFAVAITKPRERYLRCVIDKDATNATAESAICIRGNGITGPSLASITDELTVEVHHSPAEGTA